MMDKRVFFLLGFIMFLTLTGYGIVLPSLPFLADNLGLTSFQMGTLITGWATAQLIAAPFWGRLADKIGRKPVLICGLIGFGIAFYLLLFANSYWQLLLARMIGASLSAGTYPAVLSIVADSTSQEHRNVAIAKMGAINGLGFLCGPSIGGFFAQFSVQLPFIVAGTLAFITTPFAWKYLEEPSSVHTLIRVKTSYLKSFSMLTKRGYRELYLVTLGLSMAASSFFGLIGYFMIARFESSPGLVSIVFSAEAGTAVIVQFFVLERLYRIWNEERLKQYGLVICSIGFILIALSPHWLVAVLGSSMIGLGQACVIPIVVSLLSKLGSYGHGVTMGMNESMDSLGRIVGPLLGGLVFSANIAIPFFGSALIIVAVLIMIVLQQKKSGQSLLIENEDFKGKM
ncbi:MFS transporter [Pueribacillus theae]|nr:MFS transporter [Pueribacillus theae]